MYVNVYEITREYGGPEEGGWWYTCYTPVTAKRARKKRNQREWLRVLEAEYVHRSTGAGRILGGGDFPDHDVDPNDMTGVVTGCDYAVRVEKTPFQSATTSRPQYC